MKGLNFWAIVTFSYAAGASIGVPYVDADLLFVGALVVITLLTVGEAVLERSPEVR